MDWLRWYHGACSDPKWAIVARKANTNIGTIVAIWAAMLEHASQQEERGSLRSFDPETIDALYGYEDGTCAAVIMAMEEKDLIKDGFLSSWEKRQPDSDSERCKRYRDKKRKEAISSDGNDTHQQRHADDTQATQSDTQATDLTRQDKNREEQKRKDKINNIPPAAPDVAEPILQTPDSYSQDFEEFWTLYPRKVEKKGAWKCWKARLKGGALVKDLILSARQYAETCVRLRTELQYVKHPSTFLGPMEPWRDYLRPPETPNYPAGSMSLRNADGTFGALTPEEEAEQRALEERYSNLDEEGNRIT